MLVRPRPAVYPGAALLLAVMLVLAGLLAGVPASGAGIPDGTAPPLAPDTSVSGPISTPVATDGAPPVAAPAPAEPVLPSEAAEVVTPAAPHAVPDPLTRIRCVWATLRQGREAR